VARFELGLRWIIAFTTKQARDLVRLSGKAPGRRDRARRQPPFGMDAYLTFAGVARYWFAVNLAAFDH
jgi:hypothetical protein